jgi:ribonucleoside-diphosphate reductase alpha chain
MEPDTAKSFDYGSGLEGQLDSTSNPPAGESGPTPGNDGGPSVNLRLAIVADPLSQQGANLQADAPACDVCGSITVRSGTCYKCLNCGNSMGCS